MGLIGPKVSLKDLEQSARETNEGRGESLGLPGCKADAKTADPQAYKKNLELAERISKAVIALKPVGRDKDGNKVPRFVLGWRLYPNPDDVYWHTEALQHACGCNAGCFAPHHPKPPWPGPRPKGRSSKRQSKSKSKSKR
jgi:hypothetical protein